MDRDFAEQVELLMQGTACRDPSLSAAMTAELGQRPEAAAGEGRPLRVYCGFDPRTADLHLGHTVPLAKLRQFQDLGHEVTVVVGTFTSLVGDPSDKREGRELMRRDEVRRNGRTYAEQASRILDPARTRIAFNDEWLSRIGLEEFAGLASRFTVQQLVGRDNFRTRWDRSEPIQLQETFYPILQARDACELRADVQVGGSDQLFNIVTASRRLMEASGLAPNVAVIVALLPGTDGKTKMSKSLGNHIPLQASAADMFGQLMSLPDEAMRVYFELLTTLRGPEVDALLAGHPIAAKTRLAREVTARFHSPDAAEAAARAFERVFISTERASTTRARRCAPACCGSGGGDSSGSRPEPRAAGPRGRPTAAGGRPHAVLLPCTQEDGTVENDAAADPVAEETLDPQDWRAMRQLGHRMVDDMMGWLETAREHPVWQPVPAEVKRALREPLPQEGQGAAATESPHYRLR